MLPCGDIEIVNDLIARPGINLHLGRRGDVFSVGETPLDLALQNSNTECVHALVVCGAPLQFYKQEQLDAFLKKHPAVAQQQAGSEKKKAEKAAIEWIPEALNDHMRVGTLERMDREEIKQGLCMGTLPCAFSSDSAWSALQQLAAEHEDKRQNQANPVQQLEMEHNDLKNLCQRLRSDLTSAEQKMKQVGTRLEQERKNSPPPMADLSELLKFASRVIPIEQELVGQLEAELRKKKPHLAALDDNTSAQPKLSLMLNCMNINAAGIAATSSLDLTNFLRKSKRANVFAESLSPHINRNTILDLLYCGELVREGEFPFVDHEDECPVCGNATAKDLINFVKERGIGLNHQVLRDRDINGRRVLYCSQKDFPDQSRKEVEEAVDALQAIHEEHL